MQVKEDELRAVLSPAGFVWELTVPRSPDGVFPPQTCLTAGCNPLYVFISRVILSADCLHTHTGRHGRCQARG